MFNIYEPTARLSGGIRSQIGYLAGILYGRRVVCVYGRARPFVYTNCAAAYDVSAGQRGGGGGGGAGVSYDDRVARRRERARETDRYRYTTSPGKRVKKAHGVVPVAANTKHGPAVFFFSRVKECRGSRALFPWK